MYNKILTVIVKNNSKTNFDTQSVLNSYTNKYNNSNVCIIMGNDC